MNSILDTLKDDNAQYIKTEIERKNRLFDMYESYYVGIEYNIEFIKRAYRLYANTREFYALITRAIDIDVQLVPGGWTVTGAELEVADILNNSNWKQVGDLYIHFGSLFGDFYLRVYDELGLKKIQPIDPRGVWLDDEKCIIIRNVVNKKGVVEEQSEIITKDRYFFYINGKLQNSYKHPFGFIPVFYGQNKNIGLNMGLNSFHNVIDEINAVNEMATFLQEQTLRALINQKVVIGAQAGQLDYGPDKTIFLPQGATFDTVTGDIDVAGTLAFIQDIKNEVKNTLPELSFDKVSNTNLERPTSAASIQLQLIELITKIKRVRVNYDSVLKRAINAVREMDNLSVLDFDFNEDRPVIDLSNNFVGLANTNTGQVVSSVDNNTIQV